MGCVVCGVGIVVLRPRINGKGNALVLTALGLVEVRGPYPEGAVMHCVQA